MVYLTVSTGIGGGLIVNGEVYRGAKDMAGEAGHINVVPDGPLCVCGRRGCLEAVCSGTALGRQARLAARRRPRAWQPLIDAAGGRQRIEAKTVFDFARRGHRPSVVLIEAYSDHFGRALATLIALLDPELVVIGGGVSLAGIPLFVPLRRAVARHLPPFLPRGWRCVPARLGANSVLCGAARLALGYTA